MGALKIVKVALSLRRGNLWVLSGILVTSALILASVALVAQASPLLHKARADTPEAAGWSFIAPSGDVVRLNYTGPPAVIEVFVWTPPSVSERVARFYAGVGFDATFSLVGDASEWDVELHRLDCGMSGCPLVPYDLLIERVGSPYTSAGVALQACALSLSVAAAVVSRAASIRGALASGSLVLDA